MKCKFQMMLIRIINMTVLMTMISMLMVCTGANDNDHHDDYVYYDANQSLSILNVSLGALAIVFQPKQKLVTL